VNGGNPVAMIFARKVTGPLTSLVKKIDDATGKNKSKKMGSFVVFLNDDEKLADQLKALAEKEGLKRIVLTIDNPAGHPAYKIAKEADVTVVLYNQRDVKANFAFRKGELNDEAITKVVGAISKIVPSE
jgi:hypothetical protein